MNGFALLCTSMREWPLMASGTVSGGGRSSFEPVVVGASVALGGAVKWWQICMAESPILKVCTGYTCFMLMQGLVLLSIFLVMSGVLLYIMTKLSACHVASIEQGCIHQQ